MSLILSEEQEAIRTAARELVQERLPMSHLRRLRDGDDVGFSREIWREMAGLGLAGVALPAELGGAGLGYAELGLVLEECGRTLAATPFLSTIVLGAGTLLAAGGHDDLVRAAAAGERILAFAHEEGTRHAPYRIATEAVDGAGGFRLRGEKVFVLDGHVADALVVVARTSGGTAERDGLTLLLVPRSTPGVTATRTVMVDSRNAARVRFEEAVVPHANVLGGVGQGADLLDRVLDPARTALAAEMLGGISEAFERTVAYLKTRKQFGVPIGSFQGLKHRAANMFCEVELCRSIVMDALRAVDGRRPDLPVVASAAKARATEAFLLIANEAIQMHGGIGMTDEMDVGFFLKRARATEMTLGDAAFHRDRFARLEGY